MPLLEMLLRERYLTSTQLASLPIEQHTSLCETLVNSGTLSHQQLSIAMAQLFNLEVVEIEHFDYQSLCRTLGLRELITRYQAVPIKRNTQQLTLAIFDPSQTGLEQEFGFATHLQVVLVIADIRAIKKAINNLYGRHNPHINTYHKEIDTTELEQMVDLSQQEQNSLDELTQDDAPISRYIHQVLLDAIRKGASDIHFEPYEEHFRIRFRCDGLLLEAHHPPVSLGRRLTTRVKILAQLNIAERRLPQDGRTKLKLNDALSADMRISTLPTLWGEKVVLRLLNNTPSVLNIDKLGFTQEQQQTYVQTLKRPQGLIMITGPTGSGKTVTLYAGLATLNTPQRNIATAEDPIEMNLFGINQVQVQPQIGFDFSTALRTFLRQDPDVIMVGEIRDFETAEIAVKAAQTGHLVLSTLHTNSAAETLVRLNNMGIQPYNLAASLSLVIAQRLVRRLCPLCKQNAELTLEQASYLSVSHPQAVYCANHSGCEYCNQGYLGRIGLFEILPINQEIKRKILAQSNASELQQQAVAQGMQTIKSCATEKLLQGETSLAELERVLLFRE